MNVARRAILKLVGAAPIAPVATAAFARSVISQLPPAALALADPSPPSAPVSERQSALGHVLWKQLDRLRDQMIEEEEFRRDIAKGAVDADIACLRSVSAVRKAQLQFARQREMNALRDKLRGMLW